MENNNSKNSSKENKQKVEKKCEICGDSYFCDSSQEKTSKYCSEKCRRFKQSRDKGEKLKDFIICPICGIKLKVINNAHVWSHNLTIDEWKEKYGELEISKTSRLKKATLKNLTPEISKNLKKGHTLEGFIEKHGEELGKIKYNERCKNMKSSKTKEYYIEKYGEEKYNEIKKSRGITIEKYIEKYGEEDGIINFNNWYEKQKKKNTLLGYIEKHGEKKGYERWFSKNKKMSISSGHIDVDKIGDYKKYCIDVDKETRITLQLNKLENIELRGIEYHLDHMISKCYGFNNNIDSKIIASVHNLKIITASENYSKQKHCSQTIDELLEKIKKTI